MKIRFIFFLLLLLPSVSDAQIYSKEQLKKDLIFLNNSIKTYNPALYKYNPDFDQQVAELMANLPEEANRFQHLSFVSRLTALSNEGHFGVGFWQDAVHSGIVDGKYEYLPVTVEMLNGKVYVWSDFSDNPLLERGDEILAINGNNISVVVGKLYAHLSSDGDILTSKNLALNNVFPSFYYLLIDQPESYQLVVKDKSGKEKVVEIQAINRNRMIENAKTLKEKENTKPATPANEIYEFNIDGESAFLKLKTFNRIKLENAKIKAKILYKSIFSQLSEQGVQALTIDLRGNSGGINNFSDELLPYIIDQEMDGYHKKTISWEGKTRTFSFPKKSKKAFEGRIFILIDGGTFSAASIIARNIREYHEDTVIIGKESAGRYEGFAAGSDQTVYLPESNLRIRIPRYSIELPESEKQSLKNRGVIPDYPVTYTIEEVIAEKDKTLELSKQLVSDYLNGN